MSDGTWPIIAVRRIALNFRWAQPDGVLELYEAGSEGPQWWHKFPDRARNLQLLKERSWFDVPLVYVNQRRAIIAIEKGAPGERAFNEAFAAWGE